MSLNTVSGDVDIRQRNVEEGVRPSQHGVEGSCLSTWFQVMLTSVNVM